MSSYAVGIIDMQNAYFHNDALAMRKESLVRDANELIAAAERAGIAVYNIVTEHERDRSTWTLNMLDDGEGYLFAGDADAAVVDGLDTSHTERIIKTRDSAFVGTSFEDSLQARGVDTLILLGVSTHSCVLYTAADAYARNIRVILAGDAIASHDPSFHDGTLAMLTKEYRQKCLSNPEIIALLR